MERGARTNLHEQLLYPLPALRASLGKQQTLLLRKLLSQLGRRLARRLEIQLVPDEHDDDARIGLALELAYPGFGFFEGGLRRLVCIP
jgi:hypothetical protein